VTEIFTTRLGPGDLTMKKVTGKAATKIQERAKKARGEEGRLPGNETTGEAWRWRRVSGAGAARGAIDTRSDNREAGEETADFG
jgi:hypothetical protein